MSTITLPNIRVSSDLTIRLKLKDGGVAIDWSTLQNIRVSLYADDQRSMASRCSVSIDEEDSTILVCQYAANKMQYLGVNRVIVQCKYLGEVKTYDKPAFTFVRWTSDQEGEQITIDDPDVDVEITVEDVSSSILQEAVDAAFDAADRANDAAAAAEHMVDIHTGPEGKSAYEVAVEEGYTGTEEEWLASLKGPVGETPDISIGTVTTVEPGTPAAASMTGTPEAPVLNLSIPKGLVGATPNFTVGTVTTGEPGSSVIVTITGTPEAPVLNLTIPQGMQGNTGSSVDYPYELVNNLTTNDATKGLSAAQGVVLAGQVSQLEHKVDNPGEEGEDVELTAYYPVSSVYNQYINNGSIATGGKMAEPFPVLAGDSIEVFRSSSNSNTTLDLWKTDKNASSFTFIKSSAAGASSITYDVEEDGYLVASCHYTGADYRIRITRQYPSVKTTNTPYAEPQFTGATYVSGINTSSEQIGTIGTSSSYKLSPLIDIRNQTYIQLSALLLNANSIVGIAFYDSSQNAVSGISFSNYTGVFPQRTVTLVSIIRPENVAYMRFTLFADMSGYTQQYEMTGYLLEKVYGEGLVQQVAELRDEYSSLSEDVASIQEDVANIQAPGMSGFDGTLHLGDELNIIAARDNNLFKFGKENGTDYIYLSNDLGTTWTKHQNTYGELTFAYFWTDGTLMFCTDNAAYRTKDLVTIEGVTVYDYDGTQSVPSGHRFFNHTTADKPTYIDGVEWCLFYDYILNTTTNSRLWYSNDNGVTIHAAFAFGLSQINGAVVSARHAHGFRYNEFDGNFYAWSGDTETQCHIMRGTYSGGNWSWEVLKTGVEYKLGKMWFDAGNLYAVTDFTDGTMADEKGFIKCPVTDIDAENYYHLFRATAATMGQASLTNYFADRNGWRVILPDYIGGNRTWVSKNDFNFVELTNSRNVRLNAFFGPDAAGNIYCRCATYGSNVAESDLYITKMPTINLTDSMRDSGAKNFMDYNVYDFI